MSEYNTEPQYDGGSFDKSDTIRVLNWYSAYSNEDQKKAWAIEWAQNNDKSLVSKLEKCSPYKFLTYGSLARMANLGFPLSEKHLINMVDYFKSLK